MNCTEVSRVMNIGQPCVQYNGYLQMVSFAWTGSDYILVMNSALNNCPNAIGTSSGPVKVPVPVGDYYIDFTGKLVITTALKYDTAWYFTTKVGSGTATLIDGTYRQQRAEGHITGIKTPIATQSKKISVTQPGTWLQLHCGTTMADPTLIKIYDIAFNIIKL